MNPQYLDTVAQSFSPNPQKIDIRVNYNNDIPRNTLTRSNFTINGDCESLGEFEVTASTNSTEEFDYYVLTWTESDPMICSAGRKFKIGMVNYVNQDSGADCGDVQTVDYNIVADASSPTVTLGAPDLATLSVTDGAVLAITYSGDPTATTLVTDSGTSATPPTGIEVETTGDASCAVLDVRGPDMSASPTTEGAEIQVGTCTGNGTVEITVAAGAVSNAAGSSAASSSQTITVDNSGGGGGGGSTTVSTQVAGTGGLAPTVGVYTVSSDTGLEITFSAAVTQVQADAITLHCTSDSTYANALSATGGTAISDLGSATLSNANQSVSWDTSSSTDLGTAEGAGDAYCYLNVNAITGDTTAIAGGQLQLLP